MNSFSISVFVTILYNLCVHQIVNKVGTCIFHLTAVRLKTCVIREASCNDELRLQTLRFPVIIYTQSMHFLYSRKNFISFVFYIVYDFAYIKEAAVFIITSTRRRFDDSKAKILSVQLIVMIFSTVFYS